MGCLLPAGYTILVSPEGVTARKVFQGNVCNIISRELGQQLLLPGLRTLSSRTPTGICQQDTSTRKFRLGRPSV